MYVGEKVKLGNASDQLVYVPVSVFRFWFVIQCEFVFQMVLRLFVSHSIEWNVCRVAHGIQAFLFFDRRFYVYE